MMKLRFFAIFSIAGLVALALSSAAVARPPRDRSVSWSHPTITAVVFRGGPSDPRISLYGHDLGVRPPADPENGTSHFGECGMIAGHTGDDFGRRLWISDVSQLWSAGNAPLVDCMGLRISRYTSSQVDYSLGSFYAIHYKTRNGFSHGIYELRRGDAVQLSVDGVTVTVHVAYDRWIRTTWDGRTGRDHRGDVDHDGSRRTVSRRF